MLSSDLKKLFKELNAKNIYYNRAYYRLTGSLSGSILLSHLAHLYSEHFHSTEFYQSNEQLKESLGFSNKTLRNAKNAIRRYIVVTKKGLPAKNHWVILDDILIEDLLNLSRSGTSSSAQKGTTVAAEKGTTNKKEATTNKKLKNINNICASTDDLEGYITKKEIDAAFERLWEYYPVKKGKQRALGAFLKRAYGKSRVEVESLTKTIWDGIVGMLQEDRWLKEAVQHEKFKIFVPDLPHGSTWFVQARWEDERETDPSIFLEKLRAKHKGGRA